MDHCGPIVSWIKGFVPRITDTARVVCADAYIYLYEESREGTPPGATTDDRSGDPGRADAAAAEGGLSLKVTNIPAIAIRLHVKVFILAMIGAGLRDRPSPPPVAG